MSESSRSSSSSHTVSTNVLDDSLLDDETDDSELDEEERAHVMEKAAACKFAIEQFYDGFWRYSAQREARYVCITVSTCVYCVLWSVRWEAIAVEARESDTTCSSYGARSLSLSFSLSFSCLLSGLRRLPPPLVPPRLALLLKFCAISLVHFHIRSFVRRYAPLCIDCDALLGILPVWFGVSVALSRLKCSRGEN